MAAAQKIWETESKNEPIKIGSAFAEDMRVKIKNNDIFCRLNTRSMKPFNLLDELKKIMKKQRPEEHIDFCGA